MKVRPQAVIWFEYKFNSLQWFIFDQEALSAFLFIFFFFLLSVFFLAPSIPPPPLLPYLNEYWSFARMCVHKLSYLQPYACVWRKSVLRKQASAHTYTHAHTHRKAHTRAWARACAYPHWIPRRSDLDLCVRGYPTTGSRELVTWTSTTRPCWFWRRCNSVKDRGTSPLLPLFIKTAHRDRGSWHLFFCF